jgi:hypothetical protein
MACTHFVMLTSRELMLNAIADCCGCAEAVKLCESKGDLLNTVSILRCLCLLEVPVSSSSFPLNRD